MPKVLALVAQGFEEVELITVVDVLRRGGVEVDLAAVGTSDRKVKGGHDVVLEADLLLREADVASYDWLYLPGGSGGVEILLSSEEVKQLLEKWKNRSIAAICAAPRVLAEAGLLAGRKATSYPTVKDVLVTAGAQYLEDEVVEDNQGGRILTSRGPGTAMRFALAFLEKLQGKEVSRSVSEKMLVPYSA
ncbi:MAG: DJ-1/PfpI family protein [Leptospiraceae bacterium]|nr:DJ-1/PfpI family protein [Leptospiraceae bacterium]MDW8307013.1 DJ-1/PfpI family protein [Leptospiraceae bacterium]